MHRSKILLVASGNQWVLPQISADAPVDPYETANISRLVKENTGFELEPLYAKDVETDDGSVIVAAFDNPNATCGKWVDIENAYESLTDPFDKAQVIGHYEAQLHGPDADFMPWLKLGVLGEMNEWIYEQLSAAGIKVLSPPEHVKSSFVGSIRRVRTHTGWVYFKSLPNVFCRDIEITQALSAWRPQSIQKPIAVDLERKWMLTCEVCGPTLAEIGSIKVWEQALKVYAELQKESVRSGNGLEHSSLFDWRARKVAESIDPMLEDIQWLQAGYDYALDKSSLESLRSMSSRLKEICLKVCTYAVPSALEHGDLHPGNIRITQDGPVFLDWAWSSISHPFLSLCLILHENKIPPAIRNSIGPIRQTYLNEWMDYESEKRLIELARLIDRWRLLHYAVADADWMRSLINHLQGRTIVPNSYLEWSLRRRQYYLIKTIRRILTLMET